MLFCSNDIVSDLPEPASTPGVISTESASVSVIGSVNKRLPELFPVFSKNTSYHFATAGLWSTHDLVFHILDIIGPAKLTFATWSMTEAPAQMIMSGLNSGFITKLNALFDVRIRVRNPQTFDYIKNNIGQHCRISSCHAKVSVLENDDWSVSIVGSANYTNNPRIEAGVISTDPSVANFHTDWIKREIANAKPFN